MSGRARLSGIEGTLGWGGVWLQRQAPIAPSKQSLEAVPGPSESWGIFLLNHLRAYWLSCSGWEGRTGRGGNASVFHSFVNGDREEGLLGMIPVAWPPCQLHNKLITNEQNPRNHPSDLTLLFLSLSCSFCFKFSLLYQPPFLTLDFTISGFRKQSCVRKCWSPHPLPYLFSSLVL